VLIAYHHPRHWPRHLFERRYLPARGKGLLSGPTLFNVTFSSADTQWYKIEDEWRNGIRLLGIKFGFTLESFQTQITLNIIEGEEMGGENGEVGLTSLLLFV
jgi:hypothetical protein